MTALLNRHQVTSASSRIPIATLAVALSISTALSQPCALWTEITDQGPSPRDRHAMAFDSQRGVTVLFGGSTLSGTSGETWEWDGASWDLRSQTGPSPRQSHGMAFDSSRGVTVLFGGDTRAAPLGDTWEWDGIRWSQVASTGPSSRWHPAMCFDSHRGVVVLFGGGDRNDRFRDTWTWDGQNWQLRDLHNGPPGRYESAMAFDDHRGVAVLFSGSNGEADTWEWDGSRWRQIFVSAPSARNRHAIGFDNFRGLIVLFGGSDGAHRSDTWEWDGRSWREDTRGGPPARHSHAVAYDSWRRSLVLFGGDSPQGALRATWHFELKVWIDEHPVDVTVRANDPAEFSVQAWGKPIQFQWRRNGVPLSDGGTIFGSDTDTLTISRVFRADSGVYDSIVTGECGQITSDGARLSVVDPALQISPTCPGGGPISVSWQYASPAEQVALIFALNTGRFTIPQNYPCAGTRLGLGSSQVQLAWQGGAGADGSRTINGSAGPGACGGFMQLLDLDTCTTSNVARVE